MKTKNILFLLFIVAIIIGVFTKPGLDQFKDYIREKSPSPPVIEQTNGFAFAIYKASYFAIDGDSKKEGDIKVAVLQKKETYLGLFGKFWKL